MTMHQLTIALAQIDLAHGDPNRNLAQVRVCAKQAQDKSADLLILPELWSTAYDLEHARQYATARDAGMFAEIAGVAREYKIAIAGSLLESEGDRLYNTATLITARGESVGAYRKIHLVPMLEEDRYLDSGDDAHVIDAPFCRCALAICYDVRFPELWRHYAAVGAQLAILPAEFPAARIGHWRTLIPARAIENQFFVAATNRVGTTKGEKFGGHSMIVDPWGEILVEGGDEADLLISQIDLEAVTEARERIPALQDRRPDVYSSW